LPYIGHVPTTFVVRKLEGYDYVNRRWSC